MYRSFYIKTLLKSRTVLKSCKDVINDFLFFELNALNYSIYSFKKLLYINYNKNLFNFERQYSLKLNYVIILEQWFLNFSKDVHSRLLKKKNSMHTRLLSKHFSNKNYFYCCLILFISV